MRTQDKSKSWSEIRRDIQRKFSKLSEDSLDSLGESWTGLSDLVQSAYGLTKEKADSEIKALKAAIHDATAETGGAKKRSAASVSSSVRGSSHKAPPRSKSHEVRASH